MKDSISIDPIESVEPAATVEPTVVEETATVETVKTERKPVPEGFRFLAKADASRIIKRMLTCEVGHEYFAAVINTLYPRANARVEKTGEVNPETGVETVRIIVDRVEGEALLDLIR